MPRESVYNSIYIHLISFVISLQLPNAPRLYIYTLPIQTPRLLPPSCSNADLHFLCSSQLLAARRICHKAQRSSARLCSLPYYSVLVSWGISGSSLPCSPDTSGSCHALHKARVSSHPKRACNHI